ncbi:SIS domain-containing protein [soil metagenome]
MLGEKMEREIREQPDVLRRTDYGTPLKACLEGRLFDMVLLAARGSSDNAALYARYLIEIHLGIPVSLAAPSVLTRYGTRVRYPNCLVVGISQSGAAPDVAEVLQACREDGHPTLAITNTAGSRLTQTAEHTLLLGAGIETSIAATKTYSATLRALYELVRALGADLPDPDLPNEGAVEAARDAADRASGPVVRCSPLFTLGRGYGYATAQETALKLMECALLPGKAFSSADFEHGPKALAGPGSAIVSFDGEKPHLAETGSEVIVAPLAHVAEESRPFHEVVFGQWLALAASRARGLDPDDARFLRKVTETR